MNRKEKVHAMLEVLDSYKQLCVSTIAQIAILDEEIEESSSSSDNEDITNKIGHYRIIDKKVDSPQEGDQVLDTKADRWISRPAPLSPFDIHATYRRRVDNNGGT